MMMMMRITKAKIIKIKINEINEAIKMKINKIKTKITKIKKRVNSRIRISIIIFTIKKPREKRASTRKRKIEMVKNLVNMFFIKRLCNIRAYKKTSFDLLKSE